ncbi:MAG: hypothetical protein ACMG6H_09545 [Acidobacteriota bacterium]
MIKFADHRAFSADNRTRSCVVGQRLAGVWKPERLVPAVKTIALAELRRTFGSLLEGRTPGRHGARRG